MRKWWQWGAAALAGAGLTAIILAVWLTPSARTTEDQLTAPSPEDIPALITILKLSTDDPHALQRVLGALKQLGTQSSAAAPWIVAHLNHESAKVREAAIAALQAITAPGLATGMREGSDQEKLAFAQALVQLKATAVPELRKLAQSQNRSIRIPAVWAIGQVGSKASAALPELRQALKSDPDTIRQATVSVGKLGPDSAAAVPDLISLLDRPEPDIRAAAATALGAVGSLAGAAGPGLVKLIHDPDTTVRVNAVTALGRIGPPARGTAPKLITALKDEEQDASFRKEVARALGRIGTGDGLFWKSVLQSKDEDVRLTSAWALAEIGSEAMDALPELLTALLDSNKTVRMYVVEALVKMGEPARKALRAALENGSDELRLATTTVLPRFQAKAVGDLSFAMKDKNSSIRQAAVEGLITLGPTAAAAVPELLQCLKDSNIAIRGLAAKALGAIGAQARPVLAQMVRSLQEEKNHTVRAASIQAIALIGGPEVSAAIPVLLQGLKDKHAEVRIAAVQALERIALDAKSAIPGLIEALADEAQEVARGAALALGAIGNKSKAPLLLAAKSKEAQKRAMAYLALGQLAPDIKTVLPVVIVGLRDSAKQVQLAALATLEKYGAAATTATKEVENLLSSTDPEIQKAAESVLKTISPKAELPDKSGAPSHTEDESVPDG